MVYKWECLSIKKSKCVCIVEDIVDYDDGYTTCKIIRWIKKPYGNYLVGSDLVMEYHSFQKSDIIKLEKIKSEEQLLALAL